MGNVSNWILGAFATVFAVGGLFVSSHAGHGIGYLGGLAIFLFCTLFVGFLIKTSFDHR